MDELIHKYLLGELDSKDEAKLLKKLKTDKILQEQFKEKQNLYALLDLFPHKEDILKGQKSYDNFILSQKKKRFSRRAIAVIKYAAAIAVLISSTWWLTNMRYQKKLISDTNTISVPAGQRACLTLHDGTTVWLNAKSTLTYPSHFTEDKREVILVGEAYFDVSENLSAPFYVSVKNATVKVLGTEFNVSAYPESENTETSLLEGSVEIQNTNTGEKVTLIPNQEVRITNETIHINEIKQQSYFSWKDGIYSFEKERFGEIIKKLELYYDVEIIVNDSEIKDFVYTGKFRQQDGIDEILRIIQKIHNFKISRNRENNTITLKK